MHVKLDRRDFLISGLAAVALAGEGRAQTSLRIKVYRDPGCGCCIKWAEHLKSSGFDTVIEEVADLSLLKAKLGVPADLASCHTAIVDGYVIEGHVPAQAIRHLLVERPVAAGLAVPGMPVGAPGMEGGAAEPYSVFLFREGTRQIVSRYRGTEKI